MSEQATQALDLIITVDTYGPAGQKKGRTRKIGKILSKGGRMWAYIDAVYFKPDVVHMVRTAQKTLGFPFEGIDVPCSILKPDGQPPTKAATAAPDAAPDDLDGDEVPF